MERLADCLHDHVIVSILHIAPSFIEGALCDALECNGRSCNNDALDHVMKEYASFTAHGEDNYTALLDFCRNAHIKKIGFQEYIQKESIGYLTCFIHNKYNQELLALAEKSGIDDLVKLLQRPFTGTVILSFPYSEPISLANLNDLIANQVN